MVTVTVMVKVSVRVMVMVKVRVMAMVMVMVMVRVMVRVKMKKQNFKIKTKAVAGPAGIHCPCCRHGDKSWSEHQYNKDIRRYFRKEIDDQLEDEYYGKEEEEES